MFELQQANHNRTGPDALDENGRLYELKSTTRDRVSSARDVGMDHLTKWRHLNWIFGRGNYKGRQFDFEQIYFLTPEQMEPWFSVIEAKLTRDDALFKRALKVLERAGFTAAERERVQLAFRRGVLLNDPKIPWGYVRTHGVRIESDYAKRLRKLVGRN
jgi:Restriction endonuclease PvuII